MGSDANRLRAKWQDVSGKNAGKAEKDFEQTFQLFFEDTEYCIIPQPEDFKYIYLDYPLSEQDMAEIYSHILL